MSNQFQLMRETRFRPFFFTQFLGAFNDNVFKTALITLVTFRAGQLTSLDGKTLATLLPGLFILPFLLFSATSGQIADKFEKSMLARLTKVFEIAIMLLAAWGFMVNGFWQLVAQDRGPGIPDGFRSRLFMPFQRSNAGDGEATLSNGLGLSLARRIVDQAGGRLWYEAREGGGARFVVELPAVACTQPCTPAQTP